MVLRRGPFVRSIGGVMTAQRTKAPPALGTVTDAVAGHERTTTCYGTFAENTPTSAFLTAPLTPRL
jgi:hypothetical protein